MATVRVDANGEPLAGEKTIVDANGNPVSTAAPARKPVAAGLAMPSFQLSGLPPPPAPISNTGDEHGVLANTAIGIGDTLGNIGLGAAKGAGGTVYGLGKIAHGALHGDFGPFDDPNNEVATALKPAGTAQEIGRAGEQIGEFFIPGGSIGRGAKAIGEGADVVAHSGQVLAELPGLEKMIRGGKTLGEMSRGARAGEAAAKLAGRAGLEGASAAGVTYAQTGGDPEAAKTAGEFGAGATGVLGAAGVARAGSNSAVSAQKIVDLATEFGVPLTRAQQLQSRISGVMDWVARRSLGGAKTMAEFDIKQNNAIKAAGQQILSTISSGVKDDASAGQFIKASLDHANAVNSDSYGQVLEPILQQGGKAPLDVKGPLQQAAQDLLTQFQKATKYSPGLAGGENVSKAMEILSDFAKPVKTVVDAATGAVSQVPKTLNFEEAWQMRKLLFSLSSSGDNPIATTLGKGALKKLTGALHGAMVDALDTAGRPDLSQAFEAASARFRQTRELFENSMIQSMLKRGENAPEQVLGMLEGSSAETAAGTLRTLIRKTNMREVEAALWRRMLEPPTENPEGLLLGRKLKKTLDTLSTGAKEAIFSDPARLAKIERFAELADKVAVMAGTGSGTSTMKAAMTGDSGFLVRGSQLLALTAVGGSAIKSVLSQDNKGNFALDMGEAGTILLAPAIMAMLLTRSGATNTLISALKTDPSTTFGKQLVARISAWAAGSAKAKGSNVSAEISGHTSGKFGTNQEESDRFVREHPELYGGSGAQSSSLPAPPPRAQ